MDVPRPFLRRRWPYVAVGGLLLVSVLMGGTLGYFLRLDLPDVRALEDYNPPVMSVLRAADGTVAATFAEQRRMLIEYRDIPPVFLQALVAGNGYEPFQAIAAAMQADEPAHLAIVIESEHPDAPPGATAIGEAGRVRGLGLADAAAERLLK